jgi:parallel beta-helix repeat protein
MPRNGSGVYSLPAGNPVVSGTIIETAWANPTMSDIAQALTDSLPRNGAAPMVGPLVLSGNATLALHATPLQQVQALDAVEAAALAAHIADPTDAHASSAIGYLSTLTGAVARTVRSRLGDVVSVKDFGAVGDGVTNDTAAMQLAHNTGKLIYYPSGTYLFSTLTFASGGIVGDGIGQTLLKSNTTLAEDGILYTGQSVDLSGQLAAPTPMFRDFALEAVNVKTGGGGINFNPAAGENLFATIDSVKVFNFPISLKFTSASLWTVNNCKLLQYTHAGIQVENVNDPDRGDSQVTSCLFSTNQASGNRYGILIHTSGGLKITGNKFIAGQSGIVLAYNGAVTTGDLLITGNSIENQANYAVYLSRDSGVSSYGAITITGNQIAIVGSGVEVDNTGAISQLTVSGNNISLTSGAGYCVRLLACDIFNISGNNFIGNGGTPTGIVIAAASDFGKVGKNTYRTLTVPIDNQSSTTFVDRDEQVGSGVSVTHNTAYNALFHGITAVVFPTPFSVLPEVSCNATGTPGVSAGFCGYATNVTVNGFDYNIVAVGAGTTNGNVWSARGVI